VTTIPQIMPSTPFLSLDGWRGRIIWLLSAVYASNLLLFPVWQNVLQIPIAFTAIFVGFPMAIVLLWASDRDLPESPAVGRLTDMDPTTALSNRDCFVWKTNHAMRQNGALMLLDIDDFSSLNDDGHVGDLCLMAFAQRFRELTRDTDVVGRLEGSTFAVYLPGASVEQAKDVANRLSEGILVANEKVQTSATTSVGVVLADRKADLGQLLKNAEAALDHAKGQGQAKVVMDVLRCAA